MFMLDQRILPLDAPFEHNGIQYPANWLRLASAEERAALGIYEVADPVRADDRFYWNGDISNPKPVDMVRATLLEQVRVTAYTLLLPTDWQIVRRAETGQPCDQAVLDRRAAIRAAHSANAAAINAAPSTPSLAALVLQWPTEERDV